MANLTTAINVNVDAKNKEEVTEILKSLGLNMSTTINIFLAQIVKTDGIPFAVKNPRPSKDLLESLSEVDEMINNPEKYSRYSNKKNLEKTLHLMTNYKYDVIYSNKFKKNLKKIVKQGKNINKLLDIVDSLAYKEELEPRHKNHKLINDKHYKECYECHIEPDWLLIAITN